MTLKNHSRSTTPSRQAGTAPPVQEGSFERASEYSYLIKAIFHVLAFLFVFTASYTHAQSIFQDALALSEHHLLENDSVLDDHSADTTAPSYLDYLRKYIPGDGPLDPRAIQRHYQNNPFLQPFVPVGGLSDNNAQKFLGRLKGSIFPFGNDFSVVADGFSQFLIERARVELAISLFRSLKKELDRRYELGVLFPQTQRLLQAIDSEIYNADAYVNAIRSAFRADLGSGLDNVETLLRSEPYERLFKSPVLRTLVIEAIPTTRHLVAGEHPAKALDRLSEALSLSDEPSIGPIRDGFRLANLVSQSLWDDTNWISGENLRQLLTGNKGRTFLIYLGLLFEQGRDISYVQQGAYFLNAAGLREILSGDVPDIVREKLTGMRMDEPMTLAGFNSMLDTVLEGAEIEDALRGDIVSAAQSQQEEITSLRAVLQSFLDENRVEELRTLVRDFLRQAGQVQHAFDDFRSISRNLDQRAGFDDYFRVTQSLFRLLRAGYAFRNELFGVDAEDENAERFIRLVDTLSLVVLSIEQKNYSSIIVGIVALLSDVIEAETVNRFRGKILRYGSLVAGLAEAESAEEVHMSLEAATLPPGSASIKKLNSFSVALNGYIGGFYGSEFLRDPPGYNVERTTGVTIPIGLAFSFGLNKRDHGAITAFFPLVDIGAFGAFRLDDDQTEKLPAVKLKNLFAPGGYLVYDFPRAPVSLGFGAQFGPNVREFRQSGITIVRPESASGYRWSGFIAMDLPLVNLFTRFR